MESTTLPGLMPSWDELPRGCKTYTVTAAQLSREKRAFIANCGTRVPLPPRSPHLNGCAERWVRSVKEEALLRMILFGERSLWHVLNEYVAHYHAERPHQGKGNVILFPPDHSEQRREGPVCCRIRLGGLLKYYDRKAA